MSCIAEVWFPPDLGFWTLPTLLHAHGKLAPLTTVVHICDFSLLTVTTWEPPAPHPFQAQCLQTLWYSGQSVHGDAEELSLRRLQHTTRCVEAQVLPSSCKSKVLLKQFQVCRRSILLQNDPYLLPRIRAAGSVCAPSQTSSEKEAKAKESGIKTVTRPQNELLNAGMQELPCLDLHQETTSTATSTFFGRQGKGALGSSRMGS